MLEGLGRRSHVLPCLTQSIATGRRRSFALSHSATSLRRHMFEGLGCSSHMSQCLRQSLATGRRPSLQPALCYFRHHAREIIDPKVFGCAAPGKVPGQGNTQERLSKLKTASPQGKIHVTSKSPVGDISVVTLIRTDTTLDHSQKAEKVWGQMAFPRAPASQDNDFDPWTSHRRSTTPHHDANDRDPLHDVKLHNASTTKTIHLDG